MQRRQFLKTFGAAAVGTVLAPQTALAAPAHDQLVIGKTINFEGLVDQDGQPAKTEDFSGQNLVIYFFYRDCPVVCPRSREVILGALEKQYPPHTMAVFITRDAHEAQDVKKWLAGRPAQNGVKVTGMTGTAEALKPVLEICRVNRNTGGRRLNHSPKAYFFGADGRFIDIVNTHKGTQPLEKMIKDHFQPQSQSWFPGW